ncbi:Hypothetical protein SCLAV_p0611 (plasmid) [Streptomyces clavuligerus]|uniref:Uncharacterized protein n=1 Tax=Streptomyces clavuligerus TaxID=1901 RepID=D5SJK5_STRCL|nr:Hypothetical protein SCLAV_p0611 [Streptomyces clavuligerus]
MPGTPAWAVRTPGHSPLWLETLAARGPYTAPEGVVRFPGLSC